MDKVLHLGSGGIVIPGAINTDYDEMSGVDMALDASKVPYPFEEDTLDMIINSHMIEHIEFPLVEPMIAEWYRILKVDGEVIVDVPDFLKAVEMWKQGERDKSLNTIFGLDERPTQHHRSAWTYKTLSEVFRKVGFKTKEVPSNDYHLVKLGIPTFRIVATK